MKNALEIRGLTRKYEGFTLDSVDLTLPRGCVMGLIGENGDGKTTFSTLCGRTAVRLRCSADGRMMRRCVNASAWCWRTAAF